MRRVFGRFPILLSLLLVVPAAVAGQESIDRRAGAVIRPTTEATSREYDDSQLLAATIAELTTLSPTFREMIEVLQDSRHVLTFAVPSVEVRFVHGDMGRTSFEVAQDRVMGFVQVHVDRQNPRIRLGALAHEIAHVVEVACLPRVHDREDLERRLRVQAGFLFRGPKATAIETPFAMEAGSVVLREALARAGGESVLAALAHRHGLDGCPTPSGMLVAWGTLPLTAPAGNQ